MIDVPVQSTTNAQQTAAIHLQIQVTAMREEFPKAISELLATLHQQNTPAAGPVFAHHFRRPTDSFDFNVCIPVERPVQPTGRVQAIDLPALRVMRTTYHGDYSGLPHAWGEFMATISSQAPTMRGDFIETYVVGPTDGAPPADWRTGLNVILSADKGQA